jgi:steroid delta-isomerase-like uncharacterized protein
VPSTNVKLACTCLGDLWWHARRATVPDGVSAHCTIRDSLLGDQVSAGALGAHVREIRRAFPELVWTIDEVVADEGSQLALNWSAHGTHQGAFAGIPATGQWIHVSGLLLLRFEGERLIAITSRWNPRDLLRQLASPNLLRPAVAPTPAARQYHAVVEESDLDAQWEL